MPPYEALNGRKYRSPTYWDEVGERKVLVPELVQQMKEKVEVIRRRLIAAQDRQRKYADQNRKAMYNAYVSHVIEMELVEIKQDLSYVEQPVQILDLKEKALRNKIVPFVRSFWRNPKVEKSTWELESEMREK
ncbi:uncharacterized protein LOC141679268 [Apium graveolens]|uniref:uncharacterized protein LOC141679268 n=1 Tax=Apium graveolens TaxID=4045 RepID=UPI003D791B1A